MNIPSATMRLQFHKGFTFDDAVALVPYLADLGISHLYASPIMTARTGSMHGYDVVDPTVINPELGGEAAFRRLVDALRSTGLGIIIDIVPNHMAIGADNAWWMDVLQNGPDSPYAHYFDIDWEPDDPTLKNKVLLPVLGRPLGDALRDGEIRLAFDEVLERYELRYFQHIFPVNDAARRDIEDHTLAAFDAKTVSGRNRLQAILDRQHYRLAWWRSANDAINWRRFFDINELAAIRVEHDDVFDTTHATILRLFTDGLIDGVRIDHIDGLADPKAYCQRLRAAFEKSGNGAGAHKRPYIIVEKILGAGEQLPEDWDCNGTSGYDFMDQLSRVLHDPRGRDPLAQWWAELSGRSADFTEEATTCRRESLDRSFAAQLEAAVAAFDRLAQQDLTTRDIPRPALRRALIAILVHMRVYRTYANTDRGSTSDQQELRYAVSGATASSLPQDHVIINQLANWLGGGDTHEAVSLRRDAIRRFQQLSAPLAAKAVEDTAFYRYAPLLSRNDVGFDPAHFAEGIAAFHRECALRGQHFPHAMLASATHDHKRGEDVRARLAVLSEMAEDWVRVQAAWLREAEPLLTTVDGKQAPTYADAAILLQTIVGAWPLDLGPDDTEGLRVFANRLAAWQLKALREAKLKTDWIVPNEAYEAAAERFLRSLFANEWPAKLAAFVEHIGHAGAVNGLTQTLLKLTTPGVPDIYQGAEFWDQSLVDPDNRRPVDFARRRKALAGRKSFTTLASSWRTGEVKQAVIRTVLNLRRTHFDLFAKSDYSPVAAEGPMAEHVIAFVRRHRDHAIVVIATRLPLRLLGHELTIPPSSWQNTRLLLSDHLVRKTWHNVLLDRPMHIERESQVAQLFDGLTLAMLISASG